MRFYGRVELRHDDDGRLVADWVDTRTVIGLPYDSFIVGHRTDTVNTLRLWAARATRDFDLQFFNEGDYRRAVEEKIDTENISKVLYPNDQSEEGKALRLKQQYFFVACSIADIVRRYKRRHADVRRVPRQGRDPAQRHPPGDRRRRADARAARRREARLGRRLGDQCERTFGYTNHTLLPEALERWPVTLFERLLPRHLMIIYEINHRFMRQVQTRWPGDMDRMRRMSIIEEGDGKNKQVRMAHLATVGSHSINGVAALHTELIKSHLMPDFHQLWPERFNNKTNGVTPRRWVLYANPRLTRLLTVAHRVGAGSTATCRSSSRCWRTPTTRTLLDELWQVKQAEQARPGGARPAAHRRRAAARRDVRHPDQALPRVQAAAAGLPADRRALHGAQAQPRRRRARRARYSSPARPRPAT